MCFTGVDDSVILDEQVTKCNSSKSEQKSVVSTPVNDTIEKTCSELEVKVEVVSNPSVEVQSKSVDANKISALKKDVPALKFIGKETTTTTTSIQSTIAPIKNNLVAVSTSNTGKPSITSITTITSNNSTSSCVTTVTACISTGNTMINTTSPSMTTNITSTCSVGYKTLRDPPKTWNPQISRASLLKSPDPKYGDLKNVRPAKFFKMRNNMPRYLGNPASGVKPLYQVHNSPEKDKNPETLSKPDKTEIKKHSIVKIDPKTLKPISEKAPEVSNLSNQTDLKINTSSVPIFNPLKLQSSPKSERKSPKSPQSPKPKSSSPPSKRDKLNLNYTPPNPFIPNLASPTLSPNQFLYPPGPPGFPTYDPRIMAAYHSLLYGQRMPYPPSPLPSLSLDLNQRKNFDLAAPTSPKVPALSQQFSPKGQISPKPPSISETNSKPSVMNEPTSPKPPSIQPNSPKLTTPLNNVTSSPDQSATQRNPRGNLTKRTGKESGKNEKSLQNAVEKLTQNRVKELIKSEDLLKNSKLSEKDTQSKEKNSNKNVSNNNNTDSVPLVTDAKKK
ncbi:hypothetical protein ILUMI_25622 [Ignelater luminosus]|uniref:Uncharacterized protein n=1 Tax=Ignelater luminosus TaxID=2038154 RepID=A0A8K0C835_IGNLU|nr:hypothetical protein ILUMI_25622 [Ignelater luminosus]